MPQKNQSWIEVSPNCVTRPRPSSNAREVTNPINVMNARPPSTLTMAVVLRLGATGLTSISASSSRRNSAIDENRSSGLFAIARRSTPSSPAGSPETNADAFGTGAPMTCISSSSASASG